MEVINKLVFLNNKIKSKEIAFVLGIPFKSISKDDINDKDFYYAFNNKEKDFLESKGYKYKTNYIDFDYLLDYLDKFNRKSEVIDRKEFKRDFESIKKIPIINLSLSEMLIKVLDSKPKDIDCKEIDNQAYIDDCGDVWGCCPAWVGKPFGNLLTDEKPYDNYYSRLIKLSSINKSFCFCNLNNCKYYNSKQISTDKIEYNFNVRKNPGHVIIATDRTCNLRCESCRKNFFVASKEQKEKTHKITQKILETTWLDNAPFMIAGQGEVFYSEEYLNLIKTDKHRKHVDILSNGNLFDESKWKLIEGKYDEISVSISIDAATKETYTKLRHGNFDMLVKNIKMLGNYRKENKFNYFGLNFVVQRRNFKEMIPFVKFAKENNVDYVQFTKLNDWGTMTPSEYKDACLLVDDYLDYELYEILNNPIFEDKIVDISSFKPYMIKSREIYKK